MSETEQKFDYEKDITIDPNALDLEWLDQAALMLRYCRHAEQTRKGLDYAKERLDIRRAELDKAMRSDPEKFGIGRVSEGAIQNAILLDPDYQEISNDFLEAKYEANMAAAAVKAFDQRKSALENLVRLHAQQYFAGPKVPRNLSDEAERRQGKTNERIGRAMQRRKAARAGDEEE